MPVLPRTLLNVKSNRLNNGNEGILKDKRIEMDWTNTEIVLREYGEELAKLYQDVLILHDHIATGTLLNSVRYVIEMNGREITVGLNLNEVWKWIENDTKPHFPPINKILEWVVKKPVVPYKTYDGKLPTEKQLAYLIARKISEVGTKGTHDLKETVQALNYQYENRLGEAITQDINNQADVIMLEFFKS